MKNRNAPAKRLTYAMAGGAKASFIGPIHRMALRMDNLATLSAGCFSRDAKTNAASGAAFGLDPARVYPDWQSLVAAEKDKVDFLVVCTTNESHYAIARAALEAGLDVLCEKPLSLTVKEAEALGRIAARKGRVLGIPFTYTGYPMVKFARDIVRRGDLGRLNKIHLEYVQGSFRKPDRHNGWKTDPKVAGPSCVVADIGVHAFNMVEYVSGLKVESVLADVSAYANSAGLDDDASVLMRLADGVKAALVTSKVATGEENGVRLRVYGEKASLHWDQEDPNQLTMRYAMKPDQVFHRKAPYVEAISPASVRASRFPAGHHEGFVEALANIYDEFVAAVVSRRERDYPGPEAGIRSMRFVEAVLKSAKAGSRWTRI